jgi:hypothetical protein
MKTTSALLFGVGLGLKIKRNSAAGAGASTEFGSNRNQLEGDWSPRHKSDLPVYVQVDWFVNARRRPITDPGSVSDLAIGR